MTDVTRADVGADVREDRQAFHSALTNEHLVLQSAAGEVISEANSRSSLYLMSLSTTLVALGFATETSERAFLPFAAAALLALFLLGWFTVVRLVDISVDRFRLQRVMARIRMYHAGLTADASHYFPSTGDEATDAHLSFGRDRHGRRSLTFSMATMVGTVNALLGGSVVALLLFQLVDLLLIVVPVGLLVAVVLLVVTLRFEEARFAAGAATAGPVAGVGE